MSDTIAAAQVDFDRALPLLAAANSLAETFAGNIYRKVAGTLENVQEWTTDHPEVLAAATAMAALLPGAAVVVPGLNLALHVLGALGKLMAADPTVRGPQPLPSVTSTIATAA
jgi:hypothetical protein